MKHNAKSRGSGGHMRLGLLIATVAAFLLVPAASAMAAHVPVHIIFEGEGSGTVTGNAFAPGEPEEVDCSWDGSAKSGVCDTESSTVEGSETLKVDGEAAPGSIFVGWEVESGFVLAPLFCHEIPEAPGLGGCTVKTFGEEIVIKAVFEEPNVHITIEGEGSGTIAGASPHKGTPSIDCHWNGEIEELSEVCDALAVPEGPFEIINVTHEAAPGSVFAGWTLEKGFTEGGCEPFAEECVAAIVGPITEVKIKATFDLEPPPEPHPVTVHKTGTGQGWLYSEESAEGTPQYAINCGTSCTDKSAEIEGEVTLKASGYEFVKWTDCNGSESTSRECTLPVAGAEEATAEFTDRSPLSVEKEGSGQGWLYSTGGFAINCGTSCGAKTAFFAAGASVELKASGYEFDEWSECPEGSIAGRTCTLPANGQTATAQFTERHALTVQKTGNTNVGWAHSEGPAYTINCGNSCATKTGLFEPGSVTLTASGANFVQWTDCEGSPSASRECTIDLSSGDKTAEVEYVE